jgi:sulfate permease, SulP family
VLVRHSYFGHETFSKRARPSDDTAILQRTGRERAILELQGVLFFGNGDALSNIVDDILKEAKMVLLDLCGISDVDVSGASILANLMERAHARGKKILLCNLQGTDLARSSRQKLPNVDSGLQWMEDQALRAAGTRTPTRAIALEAHELTQKLDPGEFAIFATVLIARDFERGTVICREGEDADRMWLLTKGTVSVQLGSQRGSRRVASFAAGTTFGEMALLEHAAPRSASVIADEDISTFELTRTAFDSILEAHPKIAVKLLKYFAQEMVRRLRISDNDLRLHNR